MKCRHGANQFQNISTRIAVGIGQKYRMKTVIEGLAKKFFIKVDRVEPQKHRWRPTLQGSLDVADHLIMRWSCEASDIVEGRSGDVQRLGRWDYVGEQA